MNQPSPDSWDDFLAVLKKQIEEREAARANIEKSIQILKDAEQELRQQHFTPARQDDEQRDHLPYRIPTPPTRENMPGDPGAHEVFKPLNELDEITLLKKEDAPAPSTENAMDIAEAPQLIDNPSTSPPAPSPDAETALPDKVDETLQDEQIFLLGGGRFPGKAPLDPRRSVPEENSAPAPSFPRETEADLELDVPQPVFTKPHSNGGHTNGGPKPATRPLNKELPAALDQLMHYIRGGGAIRCQDPWGQNCAAFLLTSGDKSVVATDVFLNYLRKSIQIMRRLHDENLMKETATRLNSEKYAELKSRKHFLASLAEGMLKQNMSSLVEVPGLKITGQKTPPDKFDFEGSTKDFLHPGFLNALATLLKNSIDTFFLSGGAILRNCRLPGPVQKFHARDRRRSAGCGHARAAWPASGQKTGPARRSSPAAACSSAD